MLSPITGIFFWHDACIGIPDVGPFAEQVRMDFPEDIGQRIVEATRLAVMLHIQHSLQSETIPGGTGRATGGAVKDRVRAGGGASVSAGGPWAADREAA
jgi:hypothetical protein